MKTINANTNTTTTKATKSACPSFFAILTLIFIVLKLTGCITWSWVWVLAPLWIDFIIGAVIMVIAAIIAKKKFNK